MADFEDFVDDINNAKASTKKKTTKRTVDDDEPEIPLPKKKEKEVIGMSPEEFAESRMVRGKIQKAHTLFPEKRLDKDGRFSKTDKMTIDELREYYSEIMSLCSQDSGDVKIWTPIYYQSSMISERLVTSFSGVDIIGATEFNMNNPEIQKNLKLIELEYGVQSLGFQPSPVQGLLLSTVLGFTNFAQIKKNTPKVEEKREVQPPQPENPPVSILEEASKELKKIKSKKQIEKD